MWEKWFAMVPDIIEKRLSVFAEQLYSDLNEKVKTGVLPQATFGQQSKDNKKKKLSLKLHHVHMDGGGKKKQTKGHSLPVTSMDSTTFFSKAFIIELLPVIYQL